MREGRKQECWISFDKNGFRAASGNVLFTCSTPRYHLVCVSPTLSPLLVKVPECDHRDSALKTISNSTTHPRPHL